MDPGVMDPGMMDPGMMDPGMMDPGMMDPGMMDPGMMDPSGMMEDGPGPQEYDPSGMGGTTDPAMMAAMRETQGQSHAIKQVADPKESLMQAAEAMQRDREMAIDAQAPPGMPAHMRGT
jgi:hypothetical protein